MQDRIEGRENETRREKQKEKKQNKCKRGDE